jgi:hypothetical protein
MSDDKPMIATGFDRDRPQTGAAKPLVEAGDRLDPLAIPA